MGSSELERCKKSLRSILLANKGGVPAQKILKEYYSLYEEEIPYKRFNHPTLGKLGCHVCSSCCFFLNFDFLIFHPVPFFPFANNLMFYLTEKFLMSIPDVCVISSRRGEVVVEGVASSGTSHIERLVQKTAGKRGGAPAGGGGGWRGNHPPATSLRKAAALGISQTGGRSHAASAYAFSRRSAGLSQSQAPSASTFARSNPSKFYGQNKSISTPNPKRSSAVPANLNALEVMLNGLKCHSDSNVIPAMDKPLKKEWDMLITAVEASNEVWVSLTSSLEAKKQLEAELRRSHCSSSGGFNGGTLPPGNYFSAELEPGQVRRVRVIRLDRINYTAHCSLIDYGKELEVPWAKLVPLKQEFWSTKALAMKIQLFEFPRYHNVEVLEFAKKRLEGRRVFGREVREAQLLNGCSVPLVSIFEADPAGDLMFIENVIQDMKLINRGHAVNGGDKLSNGISSSSAVTPVHVSQDQGVLQQPELPGADEFYDCVVSHVVGASEIYVRSHHSNSAYCSLQHQLLAFYSAGHGRPAQTAEPGRH